MDYILYDVIDQMDKGVNSITILYQKDSIFIKDKTIVDYLNEYHNRDGKWKEDFLTVAFVLTGEKLLEKLTKFDNVTVEMHLGTNDKKRINISIEKNQIHRGD